jgi:phospholipid/cholesterol/gamma-HCH transport system substrate-binding protein
VKRYITPFRVGLFVLVSAACFAAFLIILKRGAFSGAQTMTVVAYFRDASGLGKRSRVQTAGIPVG